MSQEIKTKVKGEDLWEVDDETLESGACGYVQSNFLFFI